MDEKVTQLYNEYLKEKLDIIFDDKNTTKIPNLVEKNIDGQKIYMMKTDLEQYVEVLEIMNVI